MYIDSHLKTVSLSGILLKKLGSILSIPFSNDGSIAESLQVGNTTDNKPGQAESNFCNDKVSIPLPISAISVAHLRSTSCIMTCWTATCAFLQLYCCPTNPAESSKLSTVGSSDNSTNLSDVEACNIYNRQLGITFQVFQQSIGKTTNVCTLIFYKSVHSVQVTVSITKSISL